MRLPVQAPLPVDRYLDEIVARVRGERRLVVVAPPGAGKTTRIPPALAALGRTILLQPRRVAARALARRIALEQRWTLGSEIGWQIRFERRFRDDTRLLVATEGILTARLQSDPLLSDFAVVILDEFHERSIHADLALALVRQAANARGDLAVVVMSATMDAEPVARFLGASVLEIDARTHPIDFRYAPNLTVAQAVREVHATARGSILCFLPGAREIERTRNELSSLPNVLPLHGSLDVDAQERAIAPRSDRAIILATNVAETSLTVEGVTDVIDSGVHKILRYDAETAVDHLITEQISLDSADQRAGRAGRTAPGRATRLWDERMILRPHREPEVRRVDLASAVLDILAWGGDPRTFEWFERPPEHRIEAALELLRRIDALEGRLQRYPVHPRLARVLADGGEAAARVCALLSEDMRTIGSGDALTLADSSRLDGAARELAQVARRVSNKAKGDVRRALLTGFPDRVAMRREPNSLRLLLSSGTGAVLTKESGMHSGEFVVALQVSGGQEALVRIASVVERGWLEPTHEDIVHTLTNGKVRATKRVWYDALLLKEINVAPDPIEAHRLTEEWQRTQVDPELVRRLAFAGLDADADRRRLDQLVPERLDLPSGRSVKLEYREDGSILASAKLQELFGLADTPRLGPHKTPVTFALLSPAGRPVQVTKDLRSFWNGAYQEVRRELRGRYPKHPWPEDPWTAVPTHRAKRR